MNQYVTLLRQAGQQDELPRGLLHRAALWREMLAVGTVPTGRNPDNDADATSPDARPVRTGRTELLAKAERDLSEAETIANRGSMLIWQIEAALERSELYFTLHQVDRSLTLRVGHDADDIPDSESQATWLEKAREKLDETKRLVQQTEKLYEPHVPDWEPPEYVGVFKKGDIIGYHCRNADIEYLEARINSLEE